MRALAITLLLSFGPSSAFGGAGTAGGETLLVLPSARPAAMGQSFTAVSGNIDSLLYNPAGTVLESTAAVSLSYMRGLDGGGTGLAATSVRLWRFTLTPAYLYYNSGKMTVRNTGEAQREVTAQEDKIVIAALGLELFDWMSVGGSMKSAKFSLADEASSSGSFFDLGALVHHEASGLSAGAAMQNYGKSIKYESEGDAAPRQVRVGVAWGGDLSTPGAGDYMDYGVTALVTGDYISQLEDKSYKQFGVEFGLSTSESLLPFFAVRGGYMFDRDAESFTGGFGVKQGALGLDYAFGSGGDLSSRHQFTLSYLF